MANEGGADMIHYFLWNGVDSRQKAIRVSNRMPIIRPEERVAHATIPGRAGDLTQLEGENIYNSYIQTAECAVEGAENVPVAEKWLSGAGTITFDSQPDLKQAARIINAVTFSKISRNLDLWRGDVQFYCEPVKRPLLETDVTVATSGATITNPGTLPAFPRITVIGSGAVSITIAGKTLIIPSCVSGWVADCENQWILADGAPQWNAWQGEFPQIPVGNSSVSFTGSVSRLVISPRWRYL